MLGQCLDYDCRTLSDSAPTRAMALLIATATGWRGHRLEGLLIDQSLTAKGVTFVFPPQRGTQKGLLKASFFLLLPKLDLPTAQPHTNIINSRFEHININHQKVRGRRPSMLRRSHATYSLASDPYMQHTNTTDLELLAEDSLIADGS